MLVDEREVDIFGLDCIRAAELIAKDKVDPMMKMGRYVVTFQYSEDKYINHTTDSGNVIIMK